MAFALKLYLENCKHFKLQGISFVLLPCFIYLPLVRCYIPYVFILLPLGIIVANITTIIVLLDAKDKGKITKTSRKWTKKGSWIKGSKIMHIERQQKAL